MDYKHVIVNYYLDIVMKVFNPDGFMKIVKLSIDLDLVLMPQRSGFRLNLILLSSVDEKVRKVHLDSSFDSCPVNYVIHRALTWRFELQHHFHCSIIDHWKWTYNHSIGGCFTIHYWEEFAIYILEKYFLPSCYVKSLVMHNFTFARTKTLLHL